MRRHTAWSAAGRVHAEPVAPASSTPRSRSGQQSVEHRVASRTAWSQARGACDGNHLVRDDVDEPLEILWIQHGSVSGALLLQAADLEQPPDVAWLAHRRAEPDVHDADAPPPIGRSVAPRAITFAPLCSREYRAIVSSVQFTARMPRTLLAAIAEPMPAPSIAMPPSASLRATARATAAATSG